MLGPLYGMLNPLGQALKRPLTFLLRDEFTTNEAAPLASPHTAEPGPGVWNITQLDGQFSIASGELINSAQATPAINDLRLVSQSAYARAAGLCLMTEIRGEIGSGSSRTFIPTFSSSSTNTTNDIGRVSWVEGGNVFQFVASGQVANLPTASRSIYYQIAIVQKAAGASLFVKGGAFSEWTLLWTFNAGTTSPGYVHVNPFESISFVKWVRLIGLAANGFSVWSDDYGIATQRVAGSVSAGQAFTHEANCLIEYTVTTVPSAGTMQVDFRQQDDSNKWAIQINSSGDISLQEYVAPGAPTQRGNAAGVVSSGHRVVVIADAAVIRVFSNNVLRFTYSSATNYQAATSADVAALGASGVLSDLISWPRVLSGSALASLEAVRNA